MNGCSPILGRERAGTRPAPTGEFGDWGEKGQAQGLPLTERSVIGARKGRHMACLFGEFRGNDGTRLCETRSIGHLSQITTTCRRGML